MQVHEKVPSMTEVVNRGEAQTVKRAREIFRTSLVVEMKGVLDYEDLAKLEAWFIKMALESYRGTMGSEIYLEAGLTILNASAWIVGLELYERSMMGMYEMLSGLRTGLAEVAMGRLKHEIIAANKTIEEYPNKLVKLEKFNKNVTRIVDRWVRPTVNSVGEGLGAVPAFGVMLIGVTAGAVGFVSGKTARLSLEFVTAKIKILLAGLGKK